MNANAEEMELRDRLKLIEGMLAAGRRSTESWGWSFVLWGVAYYVAAAWASFGKSTLAWPITMTVAGILTGVVATRMAHGHPGTTLGRAMGAVWIATGSSIMIVLSCLAASGRYDGHIFVAIVGAMIGAAHLTSALILRWKMQLICAVVWLATAVIACFGSDNAMGIAFLAAIFIGQIAFGVYAMVRDSRRRSQREASHA